MVLLPCEYGAESLSDAAGPKGSAARGSSYSNLREAQLALRYGNADQHLEFWSQRPPKT